MPFDNLFGPLPESSLEANYSKVKSYRKNVSEEEEKLTSASRKILETEMKQLKKRAQSKALLERYHSYSQGIFRPDTEATAANRLSNASENAPSSTEFDVEKESRRFFETLEAKIYGEPERKPK
uniref:Uncharacterized protein n=1 Tax=Euplotes harpa TaxID=151035 RepID=A0A7S3NCJ9_9SPIT|mmetsp:Transcript_8016/g.9093  ORF Transcript_8016/g.9093 Transcript_8016/m.9093 type:complete len:124 (+) Transcript_8016:596-967(+)